MPRLLPIAAACAAAMLSAPAAAQQSGDLSTGFRAQIGSAPVVHYGGRDGPRGDRRRGPVLVYGFGSPEGWAYYNNRSFESDSYNDWWHDRPDRSLPRWVGQNINCERQYWTGAGWRC